MKSSVETIAQIKLNLVTVEQFLVSAGGLADDSPPLRPAIEAASQEVRSAAFLIDHLRSLFSHQLAVEAAVRLGSLASADTTSHQFTWSNQTTLIRASKSLVASVAKILYLAHSTFFQPAEEQSLATSKSQLDERLDNVANYSQLLRSFGELSAELVHLGQSIQLLGATSASAGRHAHALGGLAGWQLRPSASSCSALGDQQACNNDQQTTKPETSVEILINDMQALFQVNRLIIDRFILLLLSASKCCLRHGPEYLLGQEVRHQLGRQIRASVSIIMAIVKYSVFNLHSSALDWRPASANCICSDQLGANPVDFGETRSLYSGLFESPPWLAQPERAQHQPATSSAKEEASSGQLHHFRRRHQPPALSGRQQRGPAPFEADNKFAYLVAAGQPSAIGASAAALAASGHRPPAHQHQQLRRQPAAPSGAPLPAQQHHHQQQQHQNTSSKRGSLDVSSSLAIKCKHSKQRISDASLQIINYFLFTINGTQSAYDAINKLKSLIEPFARIVEYEGLVKVLNEAVFEHQQQIMSKDPSDEVVIAATDSTCLVNTDHDDNNNKENKLSTVAVNSSPESGIRRRIYSHQLPNIMLMNKRQLITTLISLLLGEVKSNVVERAQEFTDCAYTKHEHRETILLLLFCIKSHLNKLVKLVYRLCRRASTVNDITLGQLRQLSSELSDLCSELEYELKTVVIEQSDELDWCNTQLDLIKKMKHLCLAGDIAKSDQICLDFYEQSEQLIELCKMLNQVVPTHRMKIITKTLAIWFDLNLNQFLNTVKCLSENPRSRVAKDCTWAYMQVWCSFYDDFCQIARQVAYLTHAQYDTERANRVAALRDQLLTRRQLNLTSKQYEASMMLDGRTISRLEATDPNLLDHGMDSRGGLQSTPTRVTGLNRMCSFQSLNLVDAFGDITDSPRSLDHYHGFGANYHRHARMSIEEISFDDGNGNHVPRMQPETIQANPSLAYIHGQGHAPIEYYSGQFGHQRQPIDGRDECDYVDLNENIVNTNKNEHQQRRECLSKVATMATKQNAIYSPSILGHRQQHHDSRLPIGDRQSFGPLQTNRRAVTINEGAPTVLNGQFNSIQRFDGPSSSNELSNVSLNTRRQNKIRASNQQTGPNYHHHLHNSLADQAIQVDAQTGSIVKDGDISDNLMVNEESEDASQLACDNTDQQSSITDGDKWSDSDADAIVRGAKETAQMALSMYQFTKGEGDLNTTQDLFTQAELFAEEANELYKEVRCFSYKVPAGDLKKELLSQLSAIPALVQQLQFIVKNPTVGKPATFAKVDSVIRETKNLMEAVNRVVTATLSCRQHYNMAAASMRKRTRTLSPSYRGDSGFEFDVHSSARQSAMSGRPGRGMGSEPDI